MEGLRRRFMLRDTLDHCGTVDVAHAHLCDLQQLTRDADQASRSYPGRQPDQIWRG